MTATDLVPAQERSGATGAPAGAWRSVRAVRLAETALLAALAFVPTLAARPGVVTSDTKTYLYLDPSRFLGQVASMWYPTVALGTVTHQYAGYLFPMGPYFALTASLHVPTWVAQRIWLGAILFAAGTGVAFVCSLLGVRGPGRLTAALAYMLSPYLLQYAGRISVLLLPWAALGWLVALVVLALRRGGWRYPALLALVVTAASSINATTFLYAAVAPALWLVWAVAVEHEATWRRAAAVAARALGLALCCCAWWITGLVVEAGYGVDILKYTESVRATSSTSTPSEVVRGLGYWYFYGGSPLGPWTQSAVLYTQWVWLLALSYALPVLSFVSAALVRWRHRGYFVALTVVGVVLSVGAYPYTHPALLGSGLKAFMNDTTAGLALRSTDRATPVALLGMTVLLGAGVSALWARLAATARWRWAGAVVGGVVCALAVANNPAVFTGGAEVVTGNVQPASLPSYQLAAIRHLDATHPGTRVLAVPGTTFARQTWGDTTDSPQPALLTRPFAIREQQVMGSMATADTLYATDAPVQTLTENWSALAPMARLMGAGDVLVEYDRTSAWAGSPPAQVLAAQLATTPRGLSDPVAFGRAGQGVAAPTPSPAVLSLSPGSPDPPPLVDYTVAAPRPLVRAEPPAGSLIVAGNATGLASLAGQGLLDTSGAVYFAGTLDTHPRQLRALLATGATLVVSDSNRKEGFRWNTINDNYGFVETATDNTAATTPTDAPIALFPGAPQSAQTLATFSGARNVTASSFGNTVSYTPQDRPSNAADGTLRTAWETGAYTPDVGGQWWQVAYAHPVHADRVTLVQPLSGRRVRHITRVTLTFTGARPVPVDLRTRSRTPAGQTVRFPPRTFRTLRVTIDATSGRRPGLVGLAEVEVPGQHVTEVDQLPTDLLSAAGPASVNDPLIVAMTRERVSPYGPAADPQPTLSRAFTLPTARTFSLSGTATLTRHLRTDQVAALVGVAGATGSGVVATASSHLTGDLAASAGAAADGDPRTAWQPAVGRRNQVGAWLQYQLPAPLTVDRMTLAVVADRLHSVPAAVTVSVATPSTGSERSVRRTLPPIHRSRVRGATVTVPLRFGAMTGRLVRVTFTQVHLHTTRLAGSTRSNALPIAVAQIGIPGIRVPAAPTDLPVSCRPDLIRVDGHPVTVAVAGPTGRALGGGQVALRPCGRDAGGLRLPAGHHVVTTALGTTPGTVGAGCPAGGRCSGWTVDTLTLASAAGGGPLAEPYRGPARTPAGTRALTPGHPPSGPTVKAQSAGATEETATVRRVSGPFELVLGESLNSGWHAVATPGPGAGPGAGPVTLGAPELVDGFANGWPVTARDLATLGATGSGSTFGVAFTWVPQQAMDVAMGVSAAALLLCAVLVALPRRRPLLRSLRPRRARPGRRAPTPRQRADAPALGAPGTPEGSRPRWFVTLGAAAAAGGVAAAVTVPWAGLVVAASVTAALVHRRGRVLTAWGAAGLLVAAGATVVVGQAVAPVRESGLWPAAYPSAATLASVAVVLLGADAIAGHLRRTARR